MIGHAQYSGVQKNCHKGSYQTSSPTCRNTHTGYSLPAFKFFMPFMDRLLHSAQQNEVQSYRPISLLPMVSKVLERHFHELISEFISKNNILTDDQFGFQPGRCTTTPLLLHQHQLAHQCSANIIEIMG